MNLGGMEQIAQQVATQAILDHAKDTEAKLDAKLSQLERMDEDDFEKLRERRRLQMMKQAAQVNEWKANGHGRYTELAGQQDFFEAAKRSKWLAVHFYRPTTARCQIVDARMEQLSVKHLETKFCKIDAEKSPYLVEKLNIFVMPTILLVQDGKTVHQIRGFDELGATDDFHPDMLAYVMGQWGVLNFDGEPPSDPRKGASRGVNSIGLSMLGGKGGGSSIREGGRFGGDGDDEEDYEDYQT